MSASKKALQPLSLINLSIRPSNHNRIPLAKRTFTTSIHRHSILGLDQPYRRGSGVKRETLYAREVPRPLRPAFRRALKKPYKVYPSPVSTRAACREPLTTVTKTQISILDPSGARTRLFAPTNAEGAKVGDILLVRQKNGDPFAGVCLNIRRRGVETAILLRNQITRVGVEMWYKIYSPNVVGIEVVQRRVKRARRARLYYMRKPKHDMGSVQNIVTQYVRQRQVLRSGGDAKGRDANAHKRKEKVNKKK